jgi:Undecaprenyl-phosphate galactose phosphotransferase WbaP
MIEAAKVLRRFLQIIALVACDLLAFYFSLFIAWLLRAYALPSLVNGLPRLTFSYVYFVSLWWMPIIYIFFLSYETLYSCTMPFWDEAREIIKSLFLATITVMAIVTLGKLGSDKISRLVLLGMLAVSLFVFPVFRLWGKKLLFSLGIWRERVLILGAGNAGQLAMEGLEREKHMGYDVIGFLDDDESKKGSLIRGKKVFGKIKYFSRYVNELGIRTVIIAMPSLDPERLSSITARVQSYAVNTMVIPDLKGIALLNTDLLHLFYEEIFLMNIKNNLKLRSNRLVKRVFDVGVSLAMLPFILPLIGLIAVIIRLETPGTAIYTHDRIGRDGATFRCFKFRTMYRDAEERLRELLKSNETLRIEWDRNRKLKGDPRVTKIGNFLRKTSLDELPQMFNVFLGEMSLVGPRPVTQDELTGHYKDMSTICFSVPPGITGLWQVSGRSDTGYDRRVKLDAWYIMNWSLWLDVVILFRTIKVVSKMDGAY